jgi:hypothetical protein
VGLKKATVSWRARIYDDLAKALPYGLWRYRRLLRSISQLAV